MDKIFSQIATELKVTPTRIQTAVTLMDAGATIPFIARYRKEATESLDDTQLRQIEERLFYLRELEDRRTVILHSIENQGKMNEELRQQLLIADTKSRLEDLYLPYKPRRVTKGRMAIEAGLEPLADQLLNHPEQDPQSLAQHWLRPEHGYPDVKTVLEAARYILMERFADQADLLGKLRERLLQDGRCFSTIISGKESQGQKFRDYFAWQSPLTDIPSHRILAMLRGRNEELLKLSIDFPLPESADRSQGETLVANFLNLHALNRPGDAWLSEMVRWTWRVKIQPHLEAELLSTLKEAADHEATQVFARNLKDLLMAAPAGMRTTLGVDPGIRTGVKLAAVDHTGQLLDHAVIYPHEPRCDWQGSLHILQQMCTRHRIELIAIGNGTASRETDRLIAELIQQNPELHLTRIVVSEAGASVYSASELAAREFPDLDVSYRGAVSIARRLQDPMAELVKIEPKSIGVGQYQHDVQQRQLSRTLDAVVVDCVSQVGVDLNTASIPLLARVAGLNTILASNIVAFRNTNGRFSNREQLKLVPRIGDRTFEQSAGFLRITQGDNPLDATAVHPESYPVVTRILQQYNQRIDQVMANTTFLRSIQVESFCTEHTGVLTLRDILTELEKPGRDPRPEFRAPHFLDGVDQMQQLKPGMLLEGVVTNVTNFGAFVDIGVHQDGLVHISALTDRFIKDPHEVVKAGDIVQVKVLEVDTERARISLTMRLEEKVSAPDPMRKAETPSGSARKKPSQTRSGTSTPQDKTVPRAKNATLGDLLRKAGIGGTP